MKRKIIKLGNSTLVTSLPSKWIKRLQIKPGSELQIEEQGNNLIVSPDVELRKSETSITLTKMTESSIRTIITNTYRLGYDRIKVSYSDQKYYSVINKTVKSRLIGFDIITKEKNSCIIENITEPSLEQFDNLLEKLIFNIGELLNLTKERLTGKTPLFDYKEIEEKIQQYDNFCKRVVSKKQLESKSYELFWLFLTTLVHGQREIYHLNTLIEKKPINASPKTLILLEECITMYDLIKRAYFKKNLALLEEAHEYEKKIIYEQAYKFLQKSSKENTIIYHITSAVRQFYLSTSPLMGLILSS